MKFSRFAKYLSKLESTRKRLEITSILARLIRELSPEETREALYLSLGQLGPRFAEIDFAIAEKMMIKIISQAYNAPKEQVKKLYEKEGDLGNVAESLKSGQCKDPSVKEVFEALREIALISGTGSQEKKVSQFAHLLADLDPLSTRYVVRVPIGNTRLGFSEITIVEALSWMDKGDKSLKSQIEAYYNLYPDIGGLAQIFKKGGLNALKEIKLEVGVPVLPQLCQRVATADEAIEKLKTEAGAEYKYDGTRVQLHIDRSRKAQNTDEAQLAFFDHNKNMPYVKTFTRNLEDSTAMFPDLIKAAISQINVKSTIIDGEAVGIDPKTGRLIPFQETAQRKRKYGIVEKAAEIPLIYFVFDILYLDGETLIGKPLSERREILKKIVGPGNIIKIDEQKKIRDAKVLTETFKEAKERGLEGLVIKRLDSTYDAGGRGYNWVKFKREETGDLSDTIDGVILGYYFGRGNRAQFGIGGFLVGVYDKDQDRFLTVTKVGTGPSEEEWQEVKRRVDKIKVKEKPSNVDCTKILIPDVWARPEIIVVIRADEITVSDAHTAGYALRFPRLMAFRDDKGPTEITTTKEIADLYKLQKR